MSISIFVMFAMRLVSLLLVITTSNQKLCNQTKLTFHLPAMCDSERSTLRKALEKFEKKEKAELKKLIKNLAKRRNDVKKWTKRARSPSSSSSDSDSRPRKRRKVTSRSYQPPSSSSSSSSSEREGRRVERSPSGTIPEAAGDTKPPLSPRGSPISPAPDNDGSHDEGGDLPPSPGLHTPPGGLSDKEEVNDGSQDEGGDQPPSPGPKIPPGSLSDKEEVTVLDVIPGGAVNRHVVMNDDLFEVTISRAEKEEMDEDEVGGSSTCQPPPPPPTRPVIVEELEGEHILRWDPSVNSFTITKHIESTSLGGIEFNINAIKAMGRSLIPCAPYQTGHCGKSSFIHVGKGPGSSKEFAHCCLVCFRISGLPLQHNLTKCPHCKISSI